MDNNNELTTLKFYTKTLQQLKSLKKELNVKSIKDVMHHLVEANAGNTSSIELLSNRGTIRDKQEEIINKCIEIRELLDKY